MAVFKGFWHGPPIGPTRAACIKSFLDHGHQFELFTYQEFADIPEGTIIKDANSIIPRSDILSYHNLQTGKIDLGPFSDLFRFTLLNQHGGWWSDVDTVCLTSNIPEPEEAWCQETTNQTGTSQLCLKKGSALVVELEKRCLELSKNPLEKRESMGPILLTKTIDELGLEKNKNGTKEVFYPCHWVEVFKLWIPEYNSEMTNRVKHSYFLPIYQSIAFYAGLDPARLPPKGSYMCHVFEKHGQLKTNDRSSQYTDIDVREAFRQMFQDNPTWTHEPLEEVCGKEIFKELGIKRGRRISIHSLKKRAKSWIMSR